MARRWTIIGATQGNRGGTPGRGYPVRREIIDQEIDEQGRPKFDERGKMIGKLMYVEEGFLEGARPPGHFAPDDPGDEGIGSVCYTVAFWLPIENPKRWVPLEGEIVSAFPEPTDEELALLRSGAVVERVVVEAGGQIPDIAARSDVALAITDVWTNLSNEANAERAKVVDSANIGLQG